MKRFFQIVCCDAPWRFKDSLPGPGRGAAKHYETLTVDQLKAFPLPPIGDDALLFFWKVGAMPEEAYQVIRAWDFSPKSEMVWVKLTPSGKPAFGMGRTVRYQHETCVIASRGKGVTQLIRNHAIRSVFEAPIGRHSEKPDRFYEIVRELTTGRRCEMFARRPRPGFVPFGNEVERVAAE